MTVTSNFNGYLAYYDSDKQDWFYVDDNTSATKNPRPCRRCGHHQKTSKDGVKYDYCLGYLGDNVKSACCGHGLERGYILFKDGKLFEEVAYDWKTI